MKKVIMKGRLHFSGGGLNVVPKQRFRVDTRLADLLERAGIAARVVRAAPVQKAAPRNAAHERPRHPLDHDGDGRPGGSVAAAPSAELTALRREYFDTIGRRPYAGWDVAMLRSKIAEHKAVG